MNPRVSPMARARSTDVIGILATRTAIRCCCAVVSSSPDARELGIDEGAVGDQPIAGAPDFPSEVVTHHPEVIERHVRELRATGALAHRPDSGRGGLEPIVHLDEAARVELDSCLLEPDLARVRRAPRRDENVGALDRPIARRRLHAKTHSLTGSALHDLCFGAEHDVDAILLENL